MATQSVLVVDDSRVARMMVRSIIEDAHPGWRVSEAASGEEAVTAAAAVCPDYVILDVNMPGIGGLVAARQLKVLHPGLRIAILTANIQDAIRDQVADLGAQFITKPIRPAPVLAFLADGAAA